MEVACYLLIKTFFKHVNVAKKQGFKNGNQFEWYKGQTVWYSWVYDCQYTLELDIENCDATW